MNSEPLPSSPLERSSSGVGVVLPPAIARGGVCVVDDVTREGHQLVRLTAAGVLLDAYIEERVI